MQAPNTDVRSRILVLVNAILEQNSIAAIVHPDSRLADVGLTSMDIVNLMFGVEAEFDFTIPQSEITPENFQSVETLELLIVSQLKAATAAYRALGYTAGAYTTTSFTRAHTLARTDTDWSYYVHSHGDYYWNSTDARRYTGFREDSGDCSQAVIFSKDIKAKRLGRQSNLVFISTCDSANAGAKATTMPDAFAIAKTKTITGNQGPEFYVGYIGVRWDSDEWTFEQRFWNGLAAKKSVGASFDVAILGLFNDPNFDADWWGTYHWSGVAGPWTTCPTCS
jgi:acyl carrier protein